MSTPTTPVPVSAPHPEFELHAFYDELHALYKDAYARIGQDDFEQLKKFERWGRVFTAIGYATALLPPNPISALCIGIGSTTRWGLITHHVSHRAMDRVPNIPDKYKSKHYAKGWRRWVDWPDWMPIEAWDFEHNSLHHYHTNEPLDPDVIERRVAFFHEHKIPMPIKYLLAAGFMFTWKMIYYTPNNLWMLQQMQARKKGGKGLRPLKEVVGEKPLIFHGIKLWSPTSRAGLQFWGQCLLPYSALRFGVIPLLFRPLGYAAMRNVRINSLLGEFVANAYSFLIIAPNHAGDDMHRFEGPMQDKKEFYLRQILGSVNYPCGTDVQDFFYAGLNYQIEHHLWPHLPMLKYRELQPQVKAICEKHGVPYVQEPLRKRVKQMFKILLGKSVMRVGF